MLNLEKSVRGPQQADPAAASFGASLLTLLRVGWQRYTQERSCGWSREQLERHQGNRLAMLRRFIEARSPFTGTFTAARRTGHRMSCRSSPRQR
jgi:hypothetical protein